MNSIEDEDQREELVFKAQVISTHKGEVHMLDTKGIISHEMKVMGNNFCEYIRLCVCLALNGYSAKQFLAGNMHVASINPTQPAIR